MSGIQNLDYKILNAFAERPEHLLSDDKTHVDLQKLAAAIGAKHQDLVFRANYLVVDRLLVQFERGNIRRIEAITPEGRLFLERLENNRFQNRLKNQFIGAAWALIGGLALAALVYFLGLNK